MPYVELRAHTAFSFGDGSATPEALVARAHTLGYRRIAITDTADLGAIVRAQLAARVCDPPLELIVGAELNVDGKPAAFLARNAQGYRNVAALVTAARVGNWTVWDKAAQRKRRGHAGVTWEQVARHSEGVHALTGPGSGPLASRLLAGDDDGARCLLGQWHELFGHRLAVEVQLHHTGGAEAALAGALVSLAERERVPWVVVHDPRYVDERGRLAHDMLTALRAELTLDEAAARGVLHPNGDWRLLAPCEMERRWRGRTEGLCESVRIAEECEPCDFAWMRPPMPKYAVPVGHNDISFLREQAYVGARERWGGVNPRQATQIERELAVIGRLGFAGFFLVMWDAVRLARARGILCQGRGSAANSVIAFLLRITAVDPVDHGLLFERFLSEVRVDGKAEAPDIDVDFEHDRREEVLDYMYEHYAREKAAIACTVQTYRAPNAVQDAMRAFGYPPELAVSISKRLHHAEPAEAATHIRDGLGAEQGLEVNDARGQALLRGIAAFDGVPRMRSTHVGGFVLSSEPLGSYLPIEQTAMGRTIVQFDKDDLDAVGVPKFDFLGLGGLSAVRRAFDVIERRTGTRPAMYSLPYDDKETYTLIQSGETIGTFQIESRAQIGSILKTKPERLYDIVVQVALIRPGPIQAKFVHPYTERRLGREPVTYLHPALEPILKRTQGIPIFQEQAMAIAMALGGYTGGQADELRRTMGNIRKKERLVGALTRLRTAMVDRGIDGDLADHICADLVSFANYGFPESHAWSFALIAYATAWLKAHYPTEFFYGLLNSWPMGFYPVSTLIHDAKRHGVPLLPPCLRDGDWECTVEDREPGERPALRIGWRHVRGVGTRVIDALQDARMTGPFISIADVVRRARLSRADVLAFARAGAFGVWTSDRRHAAWEGLRTVGDLLPLAPASRELHHPPPVDRDRQVLLDYYAVGLSLDGHPMQTVRAKLKAGGAVSSRDLAGIQSGRTVTIGGLVTVRQRPSTAGGTIFLLLEDEWGFVNVVVHKSLVEANEEVVKRAQFVIVQGRLEKDSGAVNIVGKRFRELGVGEGKFMHRAHEFR
ncbi:MAG: DNA polymerase III subunit alpha [Gemmatimonadaceae bacterium]